MPGPKPKEVKQLQGSLNVTRDRQTDEIMPESIDSETIPMPPDYLGDRGRELWTRLCMQLAGVGILFPSNLEYLEAYCRAFEAREESYWEMREHGMYVWEGGTANKPGIRRLSQAYKAYNEQVDKMLAIGAKLGLSPVDKTRVSNVIANRTKDRNEIKKIGVTG